MKQLDPNNCSKIGYYIYSLARNLLLAKRIKRMMINLHSPYEVLAYHRGIENEAHNRFYTAKETFWEEIKKK